MSRPKAHIQEDLSMVYVSAVAANAGFSCDFFKKDYGVDAQINMIKKIKTNSKTEFIQEGIPLHVQLKASYNFEIDCDNIKYNIPVRNYNLLIRNSLNPHILILYCMPSDDMEWLSVCENNTTMKHCGYWLSLRGQDKSSNTATKLVTIPKSQIFNVTSLRVIMESINSGEFP